MSLIVVIIDGRVPYPRATGEKRSLLTQSLGTGCLLDELARSVRPLAPAHLWVLGDKETSSEDRAVITANGSVGTAVWTPDALAGPLRRLEASDQLLIIEPRYWLLDGYDFARLMESARHYRGATHVVGVGADEDDARERVECDRAGQVRRVQRLYGEALWYQVADGAIVCSILPAGLIPSAAFDSLTGLRVALASHGTLSQDWPIRSAVVDLAEEQSYLVAHEKMVERVMSQEGSPLFSQPSKEVLVAADAQVNPSARLVPPVIIQSGAVVEEGATVIGPTVLGTNSRIGRNALVAQSVVAAGSEVPEGGMVQSRVAAFGSEAVPFDHGSGASTLSLPPLIRSFEGFELGSSGPADMEGTGRYIQKVLKRALDIAASALALLILSPLLVVVAALVKLDSPGPVFFRHKRERCGGREFPCLKFRTMVPDAHLQQRALYAKNEVDGPQFKIRRDPRVTRVGWWLRATNIDELPQLINVLWGHMSLVGPRPSPFRENQICVPWRRARLSVRPGITGLWQICRDGEGCGGFNQWIYYDILYVRCFSCWLDIKILVATVLSLAGVWTVPLAWLVPEVGRGRRKDVSGVTVADGGEV